MTAAATDVGFDELEAQWIWARNSAMARETSDPKELLADARRLGKLLSANSLPAKGNAVLARAIAANFIRLAAILERQAKHDRH